MILDISFGGMWSYNNDNIYRNIKKMISNILDNQNRERLVNMKF